MDDGGLDNSIAIHKQLPMGLVIGQVLIVLVAEIAQGKEDPILHLHGTADHKGSPIIQYFEY